MENILYIADIKNLDIKKAYLSVPQSRREKADKLSFSEDKKRSLGAALLLNLILKDKDFQLETEESGKPFIKGNPFYISLSHSGDYAVLAVSEKPIGCDIEKIREINPEMPKKIFGEEITEKEKFFELWTKKESYLKLSGEGLKALNKPQSRGYSFFETALSGYKCAVCIKGEKADFTVKKIVF